MALAVPNFSEGRDPEAIAAIAAAFATGAEVLDRHSDAAHNRSVLNLRAAPADLRASLLAGAEACIERIDIGAHTGAHPCVGALDVCPIVWLAASARAEARELALATAAGLGEVGLPVFLYGDLATSPERRERAEIRRGGFAALRERMARGELRPDHGPSAAHPTAGAVLVTARPPLAAFNVVLDTGELAIARAVAAQLRQAGGGLPGVRAIGVDLGGRAQVSTNVHDPVAVSLADVIERVRVLAAPLGAAPVAAEVVGLVPRAALRDLPADVPIEDFDPKTRVLEERLGAPEAQPPR